MGAFLHLWWDKIFYVPLLNALIWLYNGPAGQNFGVAVIMLTIALRLVLLPFSILSERNKHVYAKMEEEIADIERQFKNDHEQQKERVRELLKRSHVSPWSRAWLLGLQLLVLIVLYQVFMGGIRANDFHALYPGVVAPDFVTTDFLGWNVAQRSFFWAGLVGLWLFVEITMDQRKHHETVTRANLFYRVAFPLFSVGALLLLPMVKSLFILTSMVFSLIISSIRKGVYKEE